MPPRWRNPLDDGVNRQIHPPIFAPLAELADAHASGACGSNPVEVQILWGAHGGKDGRVHWFVPLEAHLTGPVERVSNGTREPAIAENVESSAPKAHPPRAENLSPPLGASSAPSNTEPVISPSAAASANADIPNRSMQKNKSSSAVQRATQNTLDRVLN